METLEKYKTARSKPQDSKESDLSLAMSQFFKLLYVDFGIKNINEKIREWHKLTWDEFREELEKEKVRFNTCSLSDWEEFFHIHQKKVKSLLR